MKSNLPFFGIKELPVSMVEVFGNCNDDIILKSGLGIKGTPENYPKLKEQYLPVVERGKKQIFKNNLYEPKAVYGYFECYSSGDSLVVLDEQKKEQTRIEFPRRKKEPKKCIADYFSSDRDVVAFQTVTVGDKINKAITDEYLEGDPTDMLLYYAISREAADAVAEYTHKHIKKELGLQTGQRYSAGYPAWPNLKDNKLVLDLLDAERTVGVTLTEGNVLDPEYSTCAIVTFHPDAKYFGLGKDELDKIRFG